MLRADKILELLTKINQSFSVCPHNQKNNFHQFCLNQVCQLVLYEHVKLSNCLNQRGPNTGTLAACGPRTLSVPYFTQSHKYIGLATQSLQVTHH